MESIGDSLCFELHCYSEKLDDHIAIAIAFVPFHDILYIFSDVAIGNLYTNLYEHSFGQLRTLASDFGALPFT